MNIDDYSTKEREAMSAFFGDIEHLKILNKDLVGFIDEHGADTFQYNSDINIEFELRMSLVLSYLHICIEYYTRSKFKTALSKNHLDLENYFKNLKYEEVELLKKFRNKTFHENANLSEDIRVKKQLNTKKRFTHYHELVMELLRLTPSQ